MDKSYNRIGNGTIIRLKGYKNKPMIVKNYEEKKVSNDTGTFYMMTFDVVSKHNPKIKKSFILRSDWFKSKSDLLAHVKADISEDIEFKMKLVDFKINRE